MADSSSTNNGNPEPEPESGHTNNSNSNNNNTTTDGNANTNNAVGNANDDNNNKDQATRDGGDSNAAEASPLSEKIDKADSGDTKPSRVARDNASEPEKRVAESVAVLDEMVLPKISAKTLGSENEVGEFLMSADVVGTLKRIAQLEDQKLVDVFRGQMTKYKQALEERKRFDDAAAAIQKRIAAGDPTTKRVLEGLMLTHECGEKMAINILLAKTKTAMRDRGGQLSAAVAPTTPAAQKVVLGKDQQAAAAAAAASKKKAGFKHEEPDESGDYERQQRSYSATTSPQRSNAVPQTERRRSTGSSIPSKKGKGAGSGHKKGKDGKPKSLPGLLRTAVSKKKKRFVNDQFNLDLSYIPLNTVDEDAPAQIISMGFPCQGSESLYRNPYDEVLDFFETRHERQYILFNLCSERKYEPEVFTQAGTCVGVNLGYRFHDHNPPPLGYFGPYCQDMEDFISQDPHNICAVHCKAGKGRTGTMIVAYLACKLRISISEAMDHFARHRTYDGKGVTIPSQKRFLRYFGVILTAALAGQKVGPDENIGRSETKADPLQLTPNNKHAAAGDAGSDGSIEEKVGITHTDPLDKAPRSLPRVDSGGFRNHFFEALSSNPLRSFYRSLLPPVQPVLLVSIELLGVPKVEGGGFTPYFTLENNAWQNLAERNDKVVNTPTWVLSSKQLGLPSNFVKSSYRKPSDSDHGAASAAAAAAAGSDSRTVEVLKLTLPEPVEVVNEVRLSFYHKNSMRQKKKMFSFWFHSAFLEEETIFSKIEVDGAHKDKKHKLYPESFRVRLNCVKLDPFVSAEEMYHRQRTQADGFSVNNPKSSVSSNGDLVQISTITESSTENLSTQLGGRLPPTPSSGGAVTQEDTSDDDTDDNAA